MEKFTTKRRIEMILLYQEAEKVLIVKSERYREMPENFERPEVEGTPEVWWQQDAAAAAEIAPPTIEIFRQIFGKTIIS
ncbi:hypothetical protein NPIL_528121 [Nephila pilipes]|uniref:Uncharacterized protein n=1 Tax=Nephila pilipes TaxID=299642 RepID=A0A8X6QEF2_NEPPI|nr:hypothetical protein NPIL_528121 [Nephila pilipes]